MVRDQIGRVPSPPRISSAYAGTAYSVQARTSAAAVLYIAKPTDARETYVGLTRHRTDARIIVERDRLEAALRKRQSDARIVPSESKLRERLFTEARSYPEKANVADYVEDRIEFMRTGQVRTGRDARSLNLGIVARAAQRMFEAAREISSPGSQIFPFWRFVESMRHMQREVSERVAEVVHVIQSCLELKSKERAVAQDWDIAR